MAAGRSNTLIAYFCSYTVLFMQPFDPRKVAGGFITYLAIIKTLIATALLVSGCHTIMNTVTAATGNAMHSRRCTI